MNKSSVSEMLSSAIARRFIAANLVPVFLLALALLATHFLAAAPTLTFQVTGAVVRPQTWDAAQLKTTFAHEVQSLYYSLKGKPHMAHVIPLIAVIDQTQPGLDPKIKNHRIQFVIEVKGRDGYAADFSLAELLPDIGQRAVWIALDEDGKPLAPDERSVAVLSPDDKKPSRWVHGVATIRVLNLAAMPQTDQEDPSD